MKAFLHRFLRKVLSLAGALAGLFVAPLVSSLVDQVAQQPVAVAFASSGISMGMLYVVHVIASLLLQSDRDPRWKPLPSDGPRWDREWLAGLAYGLAIVVGAVAGLATEAHGEDLKYASGLSAFATLVLTMVLKMHLVADAWRQLAEEAIERDEPDAAVRLISEAVFRLHKPSEDIRLRRAEFLIAAGDFDEAVSSLTECLRLNPLCIRAGELRIVARTGRIEAGAVVAVC